jgi:tetratricopeptide (TPR) repeat protein
LLAPGPIVGALLLLGISALIAFSWRRAPHTAFFLGATLATYAIVSNAFVIIGTVLGDRLLYFPSVFGCILFGLATSHTARRTGRFVAAAGVSLILVALATRSVTYAAVWRDDATLFAYAAQVAPQSVRTLGGWGEVLAENGRLAQAREVLDRAIAIAPDFIPNRLNRGATALMAGDLDTAYADARRVLELEPRNVAATHLMTGVANRSHPPSGE